MTAGFVRAEGPFVALEMRRIEEIAEMLPERPAGFGRPISDRAFWGEIQKQGRLNGLVAEAEKLLGEPLPAWNDEDYLEFSRNGQRPRGQAMLGARQKYLAPLVIGECLENKGRFVAKINEVLSAFADEPAWTLPAHDGELTNFRRQRYTIDLRVAEFGHQMAQALYLMGEKVEPAVRQKLMAAMEERIFRPMDETLRTGKGSFWLTATHNWNAVCLGGVVGAAQAVMEDKMRRAAYVAGGEHYSQYFLKSFDRDGYCAEGTGYWGYGFGGYVVLREVMVQATGGKIDLFREPLVRNIALFGLRIQMGDAGVPPYGDCRFGTLPHADMLRYSNRVLGLGIKEFDRPLGPAVYKSASSMVWVSLESLGNSSDRPAEVKEKAQGVGVRTFFEHAGVLVLRPGEGRMAASIKASGNENHSHNDVGSFVVAVGKEQLVGDPGGPHYYNGDMFGPKRYTYKSLNSFGHPVPVIDGVLQRDATKVKAQVLSTKFSEEVDEIAIDLRDAYEVEALTKLVRTLKFDRRGGGSVVVEDVMECTRPVIYEMALPTHGTWKKVDSRTLEFAKGDQRMRVVIEAPSDVSFSEERVEENAPAFVRVGVRVDQPMTRGVVRMVMMPVGGQVEN